MRGRERRAGRGQEGREEKGMGGKGRERTTIRTPCRKSLATPLLREIPDMACTVF